MQFLVATILFLVIDVFMIWYLSGSQYFSPLTISGEVDIWNVGLFVFLISVGAGLLVSVLVYLGEKFIVFGRKEFPPAKRAIRVGFVIAVVLAILLVLHIFHFLNFFVALIICTLIVIGIIVIR